MQEELLDWTSATDYCMEEASVTSPSEEYEGAK